ncbi:hypothetical protein GCM10027277_28530 [Pseudoduganella ginsengisoli]|uniref:Uncharacterized protein n=1 Tax=Pseudoduganella ginsengisoli TaxID=1462440 RepID=A0A6L6Q0J5_9BURK|nr:hypothetical protein [Pseudoduganella ginsengisoli]MTW02954.1 hypothetical protein [Pseudoduganella ginsengisoli]
MMKSLRKAVVLALSLSLAMGGPLAEARPTQSSGSYKGGFSSQRSSTSKSTPSRSPSSGSFGSFGSSRTQQADTAPPSSGSRSAMNRDMSQKTAQDNAVRTMDERTAQQNRLPPSDPVMQRQAPPPPPPQYGNNGGYSNNPYNGGYSQPQDRPSRWGTAGAAAAGAVLGSVLAGGAHAHQAPQQQSLPSNIPADVGSIGPVGSGSTNTASGAGTVPNPMNPDDATAATPAPQVQEQPVERPARKHESSGIGWFGWVMLGLIGFVLYKVLTRRKASRQGANYTLGD